MNPYIAWAKRYCTGDIQKKGEESWRAGWYLSLYERIATQLYAAWGNQNRFNEEEKAQYFIGYLAAFPAKEEIKGHQSIGQICAVENEIRKNNDGGNKNG